jgi:hypothetical protein
MNKFKVAALLIKMGGIIIFLVRTHLLYFTWLVQMAVVPIIIAISMRL